jgi:hypothetical protein
MSGVEEVAAIEELGIAGEAAASAAADDAASTAFFTSVAKGAATVIAAQLAAQALGLNAGPSDLRPSTSAGALIDAASTYAGIPVLYGSRRVGGIRVLTEMQSDDTSLANVESFAVSPGLTYTAIHANSWLADISVYFFLPEITTYFTPVPSAPGPGQYSVAAGVYTFNAADVGTVLSIVYSYRENNRRLHLIIIWGMGEIQAVNQLYLDDVPITDPRFNGFAYYENYTGTDTQAASSALISSLPTKWTAAHQLRGLAYSYIRLDWSETVFPRGKPNITADIRGKRVLDPRDSTTKFSNNPWLCIRDYLTSMRYGWKIPAAMIDDSTFISEANYAEQRVTAPTFTGTITTVDPVLDTIRFSTPPGFGRGDGIQLSSTGTLPSPLAAATTYYVVQAVDPLLPSSALPGTTYKLATSAANALASTTIDLTTAGSGAITASFQDLQRYTCDGIVDISRQRLENARGLLSSCRGFIVFSGGLYKAKSEAVSSPVSFTLTEDNIIGGWTIQLQQRRTRYNRMRANFFDSANLWQSNAAIQDSTVYRTADGGTLFEAALDLPFTADIYRANQLAMMELKQSRFGIGVTLRATIAALQLEVGDVVPVTHTTPGWVAQLFRVGNIQLLSNDEVGVTLTQYDSSVYTLDPLSYVNPLPATSLPDPAKVQSPGAPVVVETLYATTGSAGVKSRATVSWAESPDTFVRNGGYYQLEWSVAGANAWNVVSRINALTYAFSDFNSGTYDFRIAAFNTFGVRSPYAQTTKELIGLSAPPSDVANFAVQSYSGQAKFTWKKFSANSDLDVTIGGRIFVRWSPKTVGASWNDGTLVNPDGYPGDTSIGFGPLTTGTYMAKAMDSSNNFSVNAASFIVTEAVLTALTTIATVTESPAFSGAKTNVANTGTAIQLDGTTLIDSMAALIDSWGAIDSLGGVQATGSYAFASKLDLGSVQPSRLVATIDSTAYSVDDLIDSRLNNIDDWTSMDGAIIEDAEVQLMVRSTNGDPNAAPTWGPWHALGQVGDYNARGFDFRLDFATANSTHNRAVSTLSIAAKH